MNHYAPSQVIFQTVIILSPIAFVVFIIVRNLKALKNGKKNPFSEDDLSRPPGQSLLEKLEEIDAEIFQNAAFLLAAPLTMALIYFLQSGRMQQSWSTFLFAVGISVVGSLFYGNRLLRTFDIWRNYKLGYQGELYVAQKLEPLLLEGYKIFHDIPFKNFNIDHVIVGTTGVYVLETKTKRKKSADSKGHEVTYDGTKLTFSDGSFDTNSIEQTQRNAEALRKLIKAKAEENIPVYPILTFPGWNIKRIGKGLINVVNPKELSRSLSFFENANLSSEQLRFVTMALAQHRPNT